MAVCRENVARARADLLLSTADVFGWRQSGVGSAIQNTVQVGARPVDERGALSSDCVTVPRTKTRNIQMSTHFSY